MDLGNETLVKKFNRIDTALNILKTVDYTDVVLEGRLILSPLYINTAMDRNEFLKKSKSQALHRDTVDNILRKNIYYLAASTNHVKELITISIDRGLITQEDKVTMDVFEEDHLKAVKLFVCFVKKRPAQLTLSLLIELLRITGNSIVAKILTDALKLIPNATATTSPQAEADVRVESSTMTMAEASASPTEEWSCQKCTFLNPNSTSICLMCFKSKDFLPTAVISSKVCRNCTYVNPPKAEVCEICSAETSDVCLLTGDHTGGGGSQVKIDAHFELSPPRSLF